MTEFQDGFLHGTSRKCSDLRALSHYREFDLIILASSWDARSIVIPEQMKGVRFRHAIVILPTKRDRSGLRDAHDKSVLEFANQFSREVVIIEGDTHLPFQIWLQVKDHIKRITLAEDSPLTVLIDISCCVRYVSLGAFAMLISLGLANKIVVFYSEGAYPSADASSELAFTSGSWETHCIPFLEGLYFPEKKRSYVVSLGFEGLRTLRVVTNAEPDRVVAILPSQGFRPEYDEICLSNNAPLLKNFNLTFGHGVLNAPAGDAIAVWKKLSESATEDPDSENTYYLCCGTKPHSFGMALRALTMGFPSLLYFVPEVHHVVETKPSGNYWIFEFVDFSNPKRVN